MYVRSFYYLFVRLFLILAFSFPFLNIFCWNTTVYSVLWARRCDCHDGRMYVPLAAQGTYCMNGTGPLVFFSIFCHGRPLLFPLPTHYLFCYIVENLSFLIQLGFFSHECLLRLYNIIIMQDGCTGTACEYQMGLSFYHYSCKDCKCVKEP